MSQAADTSNIASNAGLNIGPHQDPLLRDSGIHQGRGPAGSGEVTGQGFYHARIDGIIGSQTDQEIRQFQKKNFERLYRLFDQRHLGKLNAFSIVLGYRNTNSNINT
jgi:hypothetical protein